MSHEPGEAVPPLTRRGLLRGAAVGAVTVPVLAACGAVQEKPVAPPAAGTPLGSTSEVPVGGGTVLSGPRLVLTQPAKGDFKAFSAVCTHQSCVVGPVVDGVIECGCHGSRFSIADGSVLGGPAPRPLPEVAIDVAGVTISTA